jgi:acyl carrier protein
MIDTKKPITICSDFYNNSLIMNQVMYEDNDVCLCKADNHIILFNKEDGQVLTTNWDSFYARNCDANVLENSVNANILKILIDEINTNHNLNQESATLETNVLDLDLDLLDLIEIIIKIEEKLNITFDDILSDDLNVVLFNDVPCDKDIYDTIINNKL